jgi:DNA-binding NtrC family response regulator
MAAMSMAPKPTDGSPNHPIKSPKANSALLLVEGDDGVRRFLFWALYLEGFKVLTARGLSDAQRLSRDIPGRIEVLIIGSLPAGSSRVALQEQIEAERPEVRTLLLEDLESSAHQPETTEPNQAGGSGIGRSVDAGQLIEKIKAIVAASNG